MEINTPSPISPISSTSTTSNINSNQNVHDDSTSEKTSGIEQRSKTTLSEEGLFFQKLDEKSSKVEGMLRAHMTPEQTKDVEKNFQAIDKILEKETLSKEDESTLESLSEKIDSVFASSVDKMSKEDKTTFFKVNAEMEGLEEKLAKMPELEVEAFEADRKMTSGSFGSPTDNDQEGGNEGEGAGIGVIAAGGEGKSGESKAGSEAAVGAEKKAGEKGKKSNKNLNSLTTAQLNKLPALMLKKLSSTQLNKLNSSQLNKLDAQQLDKLSSANQAKLNASQLAKLS